MTTAEFFQLKQEEKISKTIEGREFVCATTGQNMVEIHVDESDFVWKKATEIYPHGGALSHFRPRDSATNVPLKPLMIVGQDESAFFQYSSVPKQWFGTTGAGAI